MKRPSLVRQIQLKLDEQTRFGQSKHAAKIEEQTHSPKGIFSYQTLRTYKKQCCEFSHWAKAEHGLKYIDQGKDLVKEYLEMRIEQGVSPYTVTLDASALAKLYECPRTDFDVKVPVRHRADITRSRDPKNNGFSEKLNMRAVKFATATGLRRKELLTVKCGQIVRRGDQVWVESVKGKGGKIRTIQVMPELSHVVLGKVKGRDPEDTIWKQDEIRTRMDVHSYRRQYAKYLYKSLERDLSTLPRSEKYYCRRDKAGIVYDKRAMLEVSRALGHNRISVIAGHYLD